MAVPHCWKKSWQVTDYLGESNNEVEKHFQVILSQEQVKLSVNMLYVLFAFLIICVFCNISIINIHYCIILNHIKN